MRHVWLPYALMRLADGTYLPVNRQYKPLGTTGSGWVDYEQISEGRIRITPALARKLCVRGVGDMDADRIYLYADASAPRDAANWAAYASRLEALAMAKLA